MAGWIYFEGTHTIMFSGVTVPTPRYEYNQIMYRLDLADPRLALPAPVFRQIVDGAERLATGAEAARQNDGIPFFTMTDGRRWQTIPVYRRPDEQGNTVLSLTAAGGRRRLWRSPSSTRCRPSIENPPSGAVPLYAWTQRGQQTAGLFDATRCCVGDMTRAEKPLCLVWRSPLADVAIAWE